MDIDVSQIVEVGTMIAGEIKSNVDSLKSKFTKEMLDTDGDAVTQAQDRIEQKVSTWDAVEGKVTSIKAAAEAINAIQVD